MAGERILLIEDDPLVRGAITNALAKRGYSVSSAATVHDAKALLASESYDAAILDRRLPDGDAAALLRARRVSGDSTPFIILSGLGSEQDVLDGYAASCDLYLRKPIGANELSAHLSALLRRRVPGQVVLGPLVLDPAAGRVTLPDGSSERLGRTEVAFLLRVGRAPGEMIARDDLVATVWGDEKPDSNALDALAFRLRKKLGALSWVLETIRGEGYRFRETPPTGASS